MNRGVQIVAANRPRKRDAISDFPSTIGRTDWVNAQLLEPARKPENDSRASDWTAMLTDRGSLFADRTCPPPPPMRLAIWPGRRARVQPTQR